MRHSIIRVAGHDLKLGRCGFAKDIADDLLTWICTAKGIHEAILANLLHLMKGFIVLEQIDDIVQLMVHVPCVIDSGLDPEGHLTCLKVLFEDLVTPVVVYKRKTGKQDPVLLDLALICAVI